MRQEKTFRAGELEVCVYGSRREMGAAGAAAAEQAITEMIERDGRAAVIFASAPSQNEFLASLRESTKIEWGKVTGFHLDEYAGMGPEHPASFRKFLEERLLEFVDIGAFHGLRGEAEDLEAECGRYAALLREAGPGLAILGIGENGHLAFIDPPVCDFADPKTVRTVELDEVCRMQQVYDGAFRTIEEVPKRALTLTIPYLMKVPRALAMVPGPRKRAAVRAVIQGPVREAWPATVLRRHAGATLFLDRDSAGE